MEHAWQLLTHEVVSTEPTVTYVCCGVGCFWTAYFEYIGLLSHGTVVAVQAVSDSTLTCWSLALCGTGGSDMEGDGDLVMPLGSWH
jgi:hypothetical protein